MAKINGKFICNRCGHVIKTKEDLDCQAVKMFQAKSISECCSESDEKYSRVDTATTLHFCGGCVQDLLSHYVYGYEIKKRGDLKRIQNIYNAVVKEYQDICRCFTPEQIEAMQEIQ